MSKVEKYVHCVMRLLNLLHYTLHDSCLYFGCLAGDGHDGMSFINFNLIFKLNRRYLCIHRPHMTWSGVYFPNKNMSLGQKR